MGWGKGPSDLPGPSVVLRGCWASTSAPGNHRRSWGARGRSGLVQWVAAAPSAGPSVGQGSSWTRHQMWEAWKGPQGQREGPGCRRASPGHRGEPTLLWDLLCPPHRLKKQNKTKKQNHNNTSYIFTRPERH